MIQLKGLKGFSAWSVYNKVAFNLVFITQFNSDKSVFLKNLAEICNEKDISILRKRLPELSFLGEQIHKTPEFCIEIFKACNRSEKTKMLVEALTFADLDDEEVLRLIALHEDQNGMPYSHANINNLDVGTIFNLMIKTMIYCSEITCDFSLMSEKNNEDLGGGRVSIKEIVADILQHNSNINVEDLISIAVKKTIDNRGQNGG